MTARRTTASVVNPAKLPKRYPTHLHEPGFWESLGRTVATFGFLEEVLGKAIFALTGTRPYLKEKFDEAYKAWIPMLEKTLSDSLGSLIRSFEAAMRDHEGAETTDLEDLVRDLRKAAEMRNILCHGSWGPPNQMGASVPFFVNRKKEIVETAMDQEFLDQVRRHVRELACHVVSTVSRMGLSFPGSNGPGKRIL